MALCRLLIISLLLCSLSAWAHNLVVGQPLPAVAIADRGELLLNNDEFSYRPWASSELIGKVRVIQYMAGRSAANKANKPLVTVIKHAQLPEDRFQPLIIVNTDDAIPGTGFFIRGKLEKDKRKYPWSQFVVDGNGVARQVWQLPEESSTIIVLDKSGKIQWVKDGALTPAEIDQVMALTRKLIDDAGH